MNAQDLLGKDTCWRPLQLHTSTADSAYSL